ncbi:MAG: cupredoxin domain-containing protein [Candidatus Peribacteraceae bacterium]|jgi:cytochrome c oxidase subunit 2
MRTFAVSAVLLVLSACTGAGTPVPDGEDTSSSSSSAVSSVLQEEASSSSSSLDGGALSASGASAAVRVIDITAKDWEFSPSAITLKKGEKVAFRITAIQGHHGFLVPELGLNTDIPEGQTVTTEFPTDRAGTFQFRCSVPCGEGHMDMTGTIVIQE